MNYHTQFVTEILFKNPRLIFEYIRCIEFERTEPKQFRLLLRLSVACVSVHPRLQEFDGPG
jgi:hypothetical protein